MFITDKVNLLDITDKLKFMKNAPMTEEQFYYYMWNGISNKNIFVYGSYVEDNLIGCIVLSLGKDLTPNPFLILTFSWIDGHYPTLWKEFIQLAENKAKEIGITRLLIATHINPKIIERKLGKFGFMQKSVIFEKDLKEVK
jgi:hypothetical protein